MKQAEFLHHQIKENIAQRLIQPVLHVIMVGDYPPSAVYVRKKVQACENVGIQSVVHALPHSSTTQDLCHLIDQLNSNPNVHGILVQLPLPQHIDKNMILSKIHPFKDVDGLTPHNIAATVANTPGIRPCTPQGCMQLIQTVQKDLKGMHAVIVGKSLLVGLPVGQLLLH
ncbi:MAG: bifunctional 5,10-methylenetetrahydrofolate dehydrogenase/5,10-methenyltetrahydrofolate cyclohydrolase, partial [Alphaproteobacteria bacterium]|nr:bifunctional 5,10-methylenetetrahydrofolate dehydrogenase/5,10-methenyltetrahydrofolate cyclohydrolase [Alphaproteobacteria bacterium]